MTHTQIIPVHAQITRIRRAETLDLVESEIDKAGADGLGIDRLLNRMSHYHQAEDTETLDLVDELVATGRVDRVRDLLRSIRHGWTTRSHVLRHLQAAPVATEEEIKASHPRGATLRAVRDAIRDLVTEGLIQGSRNGGWSLVHAAGGVVSRDALASALGLSPDVPVGVMLRAVREQAGGYAVISSPPEVDALANALGCKPAGPEILLAVAEDRTTRAKAHDLLIRECERAIQALGGMGGDDHPAQIISALAARLRAIADLAPIDGAVLAKSQVRLFT